MKTYPPAAIAALTNYILEDDDAGAWLVKYHFHELVLLGGYLVRRESYLFNQLLADGHYQLAAFIDALLRKSDAFQYLLKGPHKVWAATVNATDGDEEAVKWLIKSGNVEYVKLSEAIIQKWREYDSADSL